MRVRWHTLAKVINVVQTSKKGLRQCVGEYVLAMRENLQCLQNFLQALQKILQAL